METLGLSSSTPQKSDNIFQRLFWPTIQNQYDVDLLGQQGFWICTVVGILSGLILLLTGQLLIGMLTGFVFLAGACGVRQRSVLAATLVFTLYLLNFVGGYIIGAPANPIVGFVCVMLLLANVRASIVSNRWLKQPSAEADLDLPERSTSSFFDKVANQFPVSVWPRVKYVFFPLAAVLIVLTLAGTIVLATQKRQPSRRASTTPAGAAHIDGLPADPPR